MDKDQPIIIVGGSLTGPVMSLLLMNAGFSNVHLYEAIPPNISPSGGVIGLDHYALDVLESVGIIQNEIIPFTSERVIAIKLRSGTENQTFYPGRNTTWSILHTALMRRMPDNHYHPGKKVTSVNTGYIGFSDGSTTESAFTIFADGRRSTGRKLLDPTRKLHYAGYVAHRGILDRCPPDIRDFLRFEGQDTAFNVFPIIQDNGAIGMDWTFYLNTSEPDFRQHFGASPVVKTFMHQIPSDVTTVVDCAATRTLTEQTAHLVHSTATRMAVPIVDIDQPTTMIFNNGSSVLIGDALAPVRPHTARGANNGIIAAQSLMVALRHHVNHGANLLSALKGWESRLLPTIHQDVANGPIMGAKLGLGG